MDKIFACVLIVALLVSAVMEYRLIEAKKTLEIQSKKNNKLMIEMIDKLSKQNKLLSAQNEILTDTLNEILRTTMNEDSASKLTS